MFIIKHCCEFFKGLVGNKIAVGQFYRPGHNQSNAVDERVAEIKRGF